ncbi:MAG: dihydropteroate synthase [Burkholderiaceae bacterium]|jgi:dihydropteroate synthase|nr:dihydropteroate synthase [Burkholderiaceae bacterium]
MTAFLECGRYRFALEGPESRPLVMGILNITPDSFSDGGKYMALPAAMEQAERMIREGVDIIDIGAESTRPGIEPVSLQEELDRVMPVVEALKDCGKALSIDTYKPEVMTAVLAAGADMINDIAGFCQEASIRAVAQSRCGLCVMHMQGEPKTMQVAPQYHDVTCEVTVFLEGQVNRLEAAGVARERICIDPGFGFGKTLDHNLALFQHIGQMRQALQLPLLVGVSRKSMIAAITGKDVSGRLAGNLGAALSAVAHGAAIIRVHEVGETVDALKVWCATR